MRTLIISDLIGAFTVVCGQAPEQPLSSTLVALDKVIARHGKPKELTQRAQ